MYLHVQYIRVICKRLVSDACYNVRCRLCVHVCVFRLGTVCERMSSLHRIIAWREIMQRHNATYTRSHWRSHQLVYTCTHTNPIRWKGIRVKRSRRMIAFKGHIYIIRRLLFMYDAIKASKQPNVQSRTQSSRFSYVYKYYSLTHSLTHARRQTHTHTQIHFIQPPPKYTNSTPNILYHKKVVRYAENVQISKAESLWNNNMKPERERDTLHQYRAMYYSRKRT